MKISTRVSENRLVIGAVRISFPHLYEPSSFNDMGEKKYSVRILIDKKAENIKDVLNNINAAIQNSIKNAQERNGLFKNGLPQNFRLPLRDGDTELDDKGNKRHEGYYFMDLKSKADRKPSIVDINGVRITDQSKVYGGMYVSVSIGFYAYDQGVNKGVGAGLGNVQKIADGEPFGSMTTPETDFNGFTVSTDGLDIIKPKTNINVALDDSVFNNLASLPF